MNDWHQFIAQQRASTDPQAVATNGFFAPLMSLGLMAFSGTDAASFLHSQLTNDVEHLSLDEARLAGYCSPKGRLLATFLMWRQADTILLQLDRAIQPAIQKRLQMFVMRAKVSAIDATDNFALIGCGGTGVASALASWFPILPTQIFAKVESDAGSLIRLADADGVSRYQWITSVAIATAAWPVLQQHLTAVDERHWRLSEIAAATPHITLPTQEKFVPQMINFEAIGGVSFKKGCYPGQEIVARSQYLGKLKRRMLPATVQADQVEAGMEVFAASDATQPCGMIVNAARSDDGVVHCLVEIKTASQETEVIHLGAAGPILHFLSLPYPLPDAASV